MEYEYGIPSNTRVFEVSQEYLAKNVEYYLALTSVLLRCAMLLFFCFIFRL